MILRSLVILSFSVSWVAVSAHETDKAYFEVRDDSTVLVIEAEFPWTLRKALLQANPTLDQSKDAYDQALFQYFEDNIQITSPDGKDNKLQQAIKLDHKGHNHSIRYRLVYKEGSFSMLRNTMMFNFSSHQENIILYQDREFICNPLNPLFSPGKSKTASASYAWWIALMIIPGLIFIYTELS